METSYHHGSLRQALLTEGRSMLASNGVESVTLRELARRVNVSHAAPRRHFADRDALLAAIAAQGFDELVGALQAAAELPNAKERLTSYARQFIRFARDNGPLVSFMFSFKASGDGPVAEAAGRFFALGSQLLGEPGDEPAGPLPYVVAATLEGIAALGTAGRLPEARTDEVVDLAVAMIVPYLSPKSGHGVKPTSRAAKGQARGTQ
jgi:AcrR family transcriptional regulator